MNSFFKFFVATIAIIAITFCFTKSEDLPSDNLTTSSLSIPDIDSIAKKTTVLIDEIPSGSGVIFASEKGIFQNIYYVLTAKHVISGKDSVSIVTPDNLKYRVNVSSQQDVFQSPEFDLAVIKFKSGKGYNAAQLADYNYTRSLVSDDLRKPDSDKKTIKATDIDNKVKKYVFVSGFPMEQKDMGIPDKKYRVTPGFLTNVGMFEEDGYIPLDSDIDTNELGLSYTNSTFVGMSGGSVFDASGYVIGVHTKATGKATEDGQNIFIGDSYGIPTSTIIKALEKSEFKLPSVHKSEPQVLSKQDIPESYINQGTTNCSSFISCLILADQYRRVDQIPSSERILDSISKTYNLRKEKYLYLYNYLRARVFRAQEKYNETLFWLSSVNQSKLDFSPAWALRCSVLQNDKAKLTKESNEKTRIYKEAVDICTSGIVNSPNYSLWILRGDALKKQNLCRESITSYTNAIKIRSKSYLAYLKRSQCHEEMGNTDNALEDLNTAIELAPNCWNCYLNRSLLRDKINEGQGSISDLSKALFINETYTISKFKSLSISSIIDGFLNIENIISGKLNLIKDSVTKKMNLLVSAAPNNPLVYEARGDVNLWINTDVALKDYSKSISLGHPVPARVYRQRGYTYQSIDKNKEAETDYTKAVDLEKKPTDYLSRAKVRYKIDKKKEALEDLNTYIKVTPNSDKSQAYNARGEFYYFNSKQYKEAVSDFTESIRLASNNPLAYLNRGETNAMLKKYDESLNDCQKALSFKNELYNNYSYKCIAGAYSGKSDYSQAIDTLNTAISFTPNDSYLYSLLANNYVLSNMPEKAKDSADIAISKDKMNANAYALRSLLHLKWVIRTQDNYTITVNQETREEISRELVSKENIGNFYTSGAKETIEDIAKAIDIYRKNKNENGLKSVKEIILSILKNVDTLEQSDEVKTFKQNLLKELQKLPK